MRLKKEYDDNGNLITRAWYDSEGNVRGSWKYTYDDKGNEISSTN